MNGPSRLQNEWNTLLTIDLKIPHRDGGTIHFSSILGSLWLARRLVCTSSGHIGQAHADSKLGDYVCIILGCPVPMVFRPVDGHYEVVREAYFYGIIFGEVMSAFDRGEHTI